MAVLSTLRFGSQGTDVELLQLALSRAGFSPGAIDGIFGAGTYRALVTFQSASGLRADGIAGPATWRALTPYLTGYVIHTVRSGDTFFRIARRYNTTIRAIEAANPLVDPFDLMIGTALTVPLAFPVVPTNISFTPTVLEFCIEGLGARYPFITQGTAGRSVMGKPIYYLKLGTGSTNVFYNGSHHANEWITSGVLMKFFENYARAYAFDGNIFGQSALSLASRSTLWLMPMVNPDGVSLVTGELTSGPSFEYAVRISQDYPDIPFPSGWKANIEGIDPNLQYPAGWEIAREIKFSQGFVSPAPRDYVGAAPLEIPESRTVFEFTQNRDFALTLSYHSQGRVIFWKYLDIEPEGARAIAEEFSAVSGYAVEDTPYASGHAGYKDWFILAYDRPGYTIEVGLGTSPLPLSQFDTIYAENEGILTLGLTATLDIA